MNNVVIYHRRDSKNIIIIIIIVRECLLNRNFKTTYDNDVETVDRLSINVLTRSNLN